MANVPLHFSASIQDGLGTKKSTDAYLDVPDTTTLATLAADLGTWLSYLDGVTDGAIIANEIRIVPTLPTGIKVPNTGATFQASRVEQNAVLNFSSTGTTRKWGFAVPAVGDAHLVNGKLNLTDAAVAALTGILTGGLYSSPYNQVLVALLDAIVSFRKARKQTQRSTLSVP